MTISRETRQKNEMMDAISKLRGFFSAEDIHAHLNARIKINVNGIGIATVYRFLKSESRRGTLHAYSCSGKTLYSKEKDSHCHFVCTKCKHQEHIKTIDASFLKNISTGKACHFQLDVYGVCKKCENKNF